MQDRPNMPLLNVPRLDRKLSNKGEQLAIDSPTFYKTEQEASPRRTPFSPSSKTVSREDEDGRYLVFDNSLLPHL